MLQRRTRLARCHGLAPWRFTLAAILASRLFGVSSQREPPRGKPVASLAQQLGAPNSAPRSSNREPPTGQARGILGVFAQSRETWVGDVPAYRPRPRALVGFGARIAKS